MKTVLTFLSLVLIVIVFATSVVFYLHNDFNSSAILTIISVVSVAYWIHANGILDDQKTSTAK